MRKNKTMRAAVLLLALVMITCCFVGNTFAKYVTVATGEDSARVAYWGWQSETIAIEDLFVKAYIDEPALESGNTAVLSKVSDVIAPGTTNSATIQFAYTEANGLTAPEVDYLFTVSTEGSEIDDAIKNNTNIQWKLDNGEWGNWNDLLDAIEALDGNPYANSNGAGKYDANTLPTNFGVDDNVHTVSWRWIFNTSDAADVKDTGMGNANLLDSVKLKITITAVQTDGFNYE